MGVIKLNSRLSSIFFCGDESSKSLCKVIRISVLDFLMLESFSSSSSGFLYQWSFIEGTYIADHDII